MVVRMRHTRAHTANRRSHHALKKMQLTVAKDGTAHPRHRALLDGTMYRGRSVMDTATARALRAKKSATRRQQESGPAPEKATTEPKKEKKEVAKKKTTKKTEKE